MAAKVKEAKAPIEANLEDMIRAAAKNGELTHMSVVPVAGKGPDGIVWSATYSPASQWGAGFGRDADPVKAIKLAMTDDRFKKLTRQLGETLKKAAPTDKRAAKALDKLPAEVDDSDFLGE